MNVLISADSVCKITEDNRDFKQVNGKQTGTPGKQTKSTMNRYQRGTDSHHIDLNDLEENSSSIQPLDTMNFRNNTEQVRERQPKQEETYRQERGEKTQTCLRRGFRHINSFLLDLY